MGTDSPKAVDRACGVIEITGLTPALTALDALEKAGRVRALQGELNDLLGVCIKVLGDPASLRSAVPAGRAIAERMGADVRTAILDAPDGEAWKAIDAPPEFQPLIEQSVVWRAAAQPIEPPEDKENAVSADSPDAHAVGFIETQGFTAVIAAIDRACKAAPVAVLGKEKLGGGYVTVVVQGDVASVETAIADARERVAGLGTLIAAHVIARPSESVLALLPALPAS